MDFKLRHSAKHTNNKDLIKDLKRVAGLLQKETVTAREYSKHGVFSTRVFQNRFGSWNDALKEAGLTVSLKLDISNEMLFDNLEIVWRTLGRQPFYEEIKKPFSKYDRTTYSRRFGSWHEACKAFIKYKSADLEFITSAKQANTGRSRNINNKDRLKILKRDNYKCIICGRSPATHVGIFLHIDHIQPFSKGGTNEVKNLRTLCQKCNLGKGDDENL